MIYLIFEKFILFYIIKKKKKKPLYISLSVVILLFSLSGFVDIINNCGCGFEWVLYAPTFHFEKLAAMHIQKMDKYEGYTGLELAHKIIYCNWLTKRLAK